MRAVLHGRGSGPRGQEGVGQPQAVPAGGSRGARLGRALALAGLVRRRSGHRNLPGDGCRVHPLRLPPRPVRRADTVCGRDGPPAPTLGAPTSPRSGTAPIRSWPAGSMPAPRASTSCDSMDSATRSRPTADEEFFRVNQVDLTLIPYLSLPVAPLTTLRFGPRLRYSDTDFDAEPVHQSDPALRLGLVRDAGSHRGPALRCAQSPGCGDAWGAARAWRQLLSGRVGRRGDASASSTPRRPPS